MHIDFSLFKIQSIYTKVKIYEKKIEEVFSCDRSCGPKLITQYTTIKYNSQK